MPSTPIVTQVSAGGIAYRVQREKTEVALIRAGLRNRWQLPKGMVDPEESLEAAALREVREEAGIVTDLVCPLEQIEYWFYSGEARQRYRIHKYVTFFLMKYVSGNVEDHDQEVNEARWVEIDDAIEMLNFESEKQIMRKAKDILTGITGVEINQPDSNRENGETRT
mgnify:CR=1 FL=1